MSKRTIKTVVVQTNPIKKNVRMSLERTREMLDSFGNSKSGHGLSKDDEIDLVIFPELGFSGYIFDDTRDIEEYLEFKDRGPTYDFMNDLARKLDSYVVYSIPEKVIDELVADGEYNRILIFSYFIFRLWISHI